MYTFFLNLLYFVTCVIIFFKYGGQMTDTLGLITMGSQFVIFLGIVIMYIKDPVVFKRFRLEFKGSELHYNHYALYFINLVTSVVLMAFVPSHPWAPAIPQMLFLLYTLILRPYKQLLDNFRSAFYLLLMASATGLKTYIYFIKGDYHDMGQYIWLIVQ